MYSFSLARLLLPVHISGLGSVFGGSPCRIVCFRAVQTSCLLEYSMVGLACIVYNTLPTRSHLGLVGLQLACPGGQPAAPGQATGLGAPARSRRPARLARPQKVPWRAPPAASMQIRRSSSSSHFDKQSHYLYPYLYLYPNFYHNHPSCSHEIPTKHVYISNYSTCCNIVSNIILIIW
jgi:hypothetical protein